MMALVPGSTVAVVGSNIDKSNNYVYFKNEFFGGNYYYFHDLL
jgi:hypothetical protein